MYLNQGMFCYYKIDFNNNNKKTALNLPQFFQRSIGNEIFEVSKRVYNQSLYMSKITSKA